MDKNIAAVTMKSQTLERLETVAEAIANAVTHGIGAALSIAAMIILTTAALKQENALKIISSFVFGSTLIFTYSASTLYHSLPYPTIKRILRIFDHSSIFLLIAGTYTPFALVTLHGPLGWSLFGVVWGIAIVGIAYKIIFKHRYEIFSLMLYLAMGWLIIVVLKPLLHAIPISCALLMLAGGMAYTIGIIFYSAKRLTFGHTIWHLFVLAGSAFHFFAIWLYVIK